MGAVGVVVVEVVDDESMELALVPDDGAVEELAAQGADPTFREGVGHWCAHGGLEDPETFGGEDFVEGGDELAAAVAYERSGVGEQVGMAPGQSEPASGETTASRSRAGSRGEGPHPSERTVR